MPDLIASQPDVIRGATELIRTCLAVTDADRVLVLTDRRTRPLADVIADQARTVTAATVAVIPDIAAGYELARQEIGRVLDARRPTVTVFAAADPGDLLAWDPTFWAHLERFGARHAHMPALDDACLGIGMAVDYTEVARFTLGVRDLLSDARSVRVTSASGTDLLLNCGPGRPWTPFTGLYQCVGQGGRLPQGEVFCTPLTADGILAVSVVGYPFNAASGLLAEPLLIEVEGGTAVGFDHPDQELRSQVRDWLTNAPGGLRLGEFALGTNRALPAITGNLLFDENVPGVHIAFGHPFPDYTGADWESPVHVDMVVDRPSVHADGLTVLADGQYCIPSRLPRS
ncbi:aminopeptidase [Streptomyces albipurpureus]|uniref:Aminopeptidase n=1 Tax=Streptomyces albipurpureus TaxID=2897419 RepID=A0ABT0UE75_9ACTN|nr:aminopeptidase [Streptomyces sp. CWNU-1]MCM2386797.1 aminopeptidase [Streptomyces sp. CWNU-1]